jgi:hypothetical protein
MDRPTISGSSPHARRQSSSEITTVKGAPIADPSSV